MNIFGFELNIEKVGIKLKSILSVDTKVDNRKIEAQQITQIQEQNNLSSSVTNNILFVGQAPAQEVLDKMGMGAIAPIDVPAISAGDANLPQIRKEGKPKELIEKYLSEHTENNSFYIDIDRLIFFYDERLNIDFSEAELVFLVESSLKNSFPFWFWSFLYREKFSNVVPLFKQVFENKDLKIRLGLVAAIGRFTNTSDSIVEWAQTEKNEKVLGAIIVDLHKGGEDALAQRVIVNAISRKLIPDLDYREIKKLEASLGKNEKKCLHEAILSGWPNERVKALNILSATATEEDLSLLESLLEKEAGQTALSILHCIARIGKVNNKEAIEKQLVDTRSEDLFLQVLDTIIAVKDISVLPQLFEWLKKPSDLTSKFLSELHEWQVTSHLDRAVTSLMDKDFYEKVVLDILSVPEGKYRSVFTWRQFNLLEDTENKEVIQLIFSEERLSAYPEWSKVIGKVTLNKALAEKNKQGLLTIAESENYRDAMLAFREIWTMVTTEEALELKLKIEEKREELLLRLRAFVDGDYSEEIKGLAKNDLDYFLGENDHFFENYTKKDTDKEDPFSKLLQDISTFSVIEKEYIRFILKKKDGVTKQFLIDHIGRPFEEVYKAIVPDWTDLDPKEIEEKLKGVLTGHENPTIRLDALSAAGRIGIMSDAEVRALALPAWKEARAAMLRSVGTRADDRVTNHIIYYGAIDVLSEIGDIGDLPIIEESIERNPVLHRFYGRYGFFHHILTFRKLFEALSLTTNEDETESIISTLDTLDYNWSKESLGIEE